MSLTIQIAAPFLTLAAYAKATGQTEEAVKKQANLGKLPVIKFNEPGKRGLLHVNMVALFMQAEAHANSLQVNGA